MTNEKKMEEFIRIANEMPIEHRMSMVFTFLLTSDERFLTCTVEYLKEIKEMMDKQKKATEV